MVYKNWKEQYERVKRAEEKAKPLIEKYDKMTIDEKLKYIREHREQYKREINIIHRYYNLDNRFGGYVE